METKEISIGQISDLLSFSSSFFLPTRQDGTFDTLKFCQKFEEKGILKLFISTIDNQNVGYISLLLHPENKSLDIGPMFILPEFSGQGFGKKQVEFVQNYAKENNFQKIETRTWGQNKGSRKIFESLNFSKTREIENDRINGDSTIFFELTFPQI